MSSKQMIYTVHDVKGETFMPPFFVPSKGLAIRAFEDCINSPDHHFGKHPADYTLFSLGYFDTDTGEIVQADRVSVGNGIEFVKPENMKPLGNSQNANSSRSPDEDR
nr:MAG: nonstructural protein [Microvirus sp.]